jgi:predicted homoserine dehydrogenase-like protein
MGLAAGCVVNKDISKDTVLKYGDVELPKGRLVNRLRREQDALSGSSPA